MVIFLSVLTFFMGCINNGQSLAEGALSAFGQYEEAIDTTQCAANLQQELSSDTSKWLADITVKDYYRQHHEPIWYTNMGVSSDADSLLSYLRHELPLNGLDTTAFYIPQIAANLDVVHQLAFDSIGRDINEVLPQLDYLLSKVFVRFSTGQRYGFTRPAR